MILLTQPNQGLRKVVKSEEARRSVAQRVEARNPNGRGGYLGSKEWAASPLPTR